MSENSKIEWTDHTFNPWSGCVKVSPACQHCYAAALPPAYRRNAVWGAHTDRMPASDSYWAQPLAWDRKARKEGVRRRVFCASTADVFEDRADLDPLRERLWDLIQKTPNLDWLLLTKRPEVMFKWSQSHPWPVNAWAGTTVESQEWADRRIPHLLKVPAQIRFLSCEPLLGAIDISGYLTRPQWGEVNEHGTRPYQIVPRNDLIQWVIAGGESGPNARPSHPDWFRLLRDQCREAGVPFLLKQWGEWAPGEEVEANGTDWCGMYEPDRDNGGVPKHYWPDSPLRETAMRLGKGEMSQNLCDDTCVLRVGKKAAGRLLDGVEHNEFPVAGQL